MNTHLPEALNEAQHRGIELFMGENCEWKIEFEGSVDSIQQVVQAPVFVFANNGFGDCLFLKQHPESDSFEEEVFEFFHEGPEIYEVPETLEILLGLRERAASADAYPAALYDTGELVQLADLVQVKVWVEFWKGWQDGEVEYVPGVSRKRLEHEHGGLKWVAIRFRNGQICPLVDPESGKLRKVRFIRRSDTDQEVEQTPAPNPPGR